MPNNPGETVVGNRTIFSAIPPLERMLGVAGFIRIETRPRGSDLTVAAYKNMSVFYRWLRSGPVGVIAALLVSPLALPVLIVGWLSLRCSAGSHDDCLGYTVTASPDA